MERQDMENTMVGSRGSENTMVGSHGSENTMMGSRGTENTMVGSHGSENTMMGSRGAENTMMGSRHGENVSVSAGNGSRWPDELLLGRGATVGEYVITDYISMSGEADVYKGERDGKEYAVKIYKKEVSLKEDVVEQLKGKERPHLAYMVEVGETPIEHRAGVFLNRTYEVVPLYRQVNKPIPYVQLLELIRQVNEGLHTLHTEFHIFHKDIKPANIMIDENDNYRIIDFGISSVAMEGQSHINNTTTGLSLDYASPDTRATYKAGAAEDYYSFGISIYEFFAGELPYSELGDANNRYEQLNSVGVTVRESLHMPAELVKLIHGLTFYSNNAAICKKRWGYEQVKQWLENPQSMEDLDMSAYGGQKKESASEVPANTKASVVYKNVLGLQDGRVQDSYSLADKLGSRWDEGKKLVGRGLLGNFFMENGGEFTTYTSACEDVREILNEDVGELEEDVAFWKLLYFLEPKLDKFYWGVKKENGLTDYTCEELGVYFFLQPLYAQESGIPQKTGSFMENRLLGVYLKDCLKDEARSTRAEKYLAVYYDSEDEKERRKALWKLGYLLVGKAEFRYHNEKFETLQQMYQHVIAWTNSLSREEAVKVARAFEETDEFLAWSEYQKEA